MKLKTFVLSLLSAVLVFALAGCNVFTADTAELLKPPALSGDIAPISEAIKKSAGGEYTLKYPSGGNYRSAVVQNDIDGDGILEAFAFYSMTEGENTVMYINVICSENGEWVSAARQKIVASGVNRLEFSDLDGDGIQEILVGWEIYGTSEMQLAVYSYKDKIITQRMMQQYTSFVCCDLDENGYNEIMIVRLNPTEQVNLASLYVITESGVTELYSCPLDPAVTAVSNITVSQLSSGKEAVYIDEVKGVGAVTEVLFIEKNRLVNPLYNAEFRETTATLRSFSYSITDINGDGITEIPVQEDVPAISKSNVNEKLYLTKWCSFNGETLTVQLTTLMNNEDGYYYIVPSKWLGRIAVFRDADKNLREIYSYDPASMTAGRQLLSLKTVSGEEYEAEAVSGGYEYLMSYGDKVYICRISETAAKEGLSFDEVKKNFRIIE